MKQILYDTVEPDYGHRSSKQCPVVQSPQLPPIFKQLTFHSGKMEIYWLVSTPPPCIGKRPIYFQVFFLLKVSLREGLNKKLVDFFTKRLTPLPP